MLDDIRSMDDVRKYTKLPIIPNEQWTVVRSYSEFVNIINKLGLPKFVSLDHDLGLSHYGHGLNGDDIPYDSYTEKTGYDCVKTLVEYCIHNKLKFPDYQVHSMNPVGKMNIISLIENFKKYYFTNIQNL